MSQNGYCYAIHIFLLFKKPDFAIQTFISKSDSIGLVRGGLELDCFSINPAVFVVNAQGTRAQNSQSLDRLRAKCCASCARAKTVQIGFTIASYCRNGPYFRASKKMYLPFCPHQRNTDGILETATLLINQSTTLILPRLQSNHLQPILLSGTRLIRL